jgi:hypothetical protein
VLDAEAIAEVARELSAKRELAAKKK